MNSSIVAVARSAKHTFSKHLEPHITLLAGLGVEGDAHCGELVKHRYLVRKNPNAANLGQVHLLHSELFAELAAKDLSIAPGDMGENVTTTGIDLLDLSEGTLLHLGLEAIVKLTGLRTPCTQMDDLRPGLMKACLGHGPAGVIRKAGVMGIVLSGGIVRAGDTIRIEAPEGAWRPLRPV